MKKELSKHTARPRYIVRSLNSANNTVKISKLTDSQLRSVQYETSLSSIIPVISDVLPLNSDYHMSDTDSSSESDTDHPGNADFNYGQPDADTIAPRRRVQPQWMRSNEWILE